MNDDNDSHNSDDNDLLDSVSFLGDMFATGSATSTRHNLKFSIPLSQTEHFSSFARAPVVHVENCGDESCPLPDYPLPPVSVLSSSSNDTDSNNREIEAGRLALHVTIYSKGVAGDSATDGGDLTGFTSRFEEMRLLCAFLIKNRQVACLNKTLLEVGAGLAVPSHVAIACGANHPVYATDGCWSAIRHHHHPALQCSILKWIQDEEAKKEIMESTDAIPSNVDVVFGSGIAYALSALDILLATVRRILQAGRQSPEQDEPSLKYFICGFKKRQVALSDLLQIARRYNFNFVPPAAEYKPICSKMEDEESELGVLVFEFEDSVPS